jgi:WD40 repeat protein
LLASGSGDSTIRVWTVATGKCRQLLDSHENHVWSVVFSPVAIGGKMLLASGSEDGTVNLWQVQTGDPSGICGAKRLNSLKGHKKQVYAVAFSPDGRTLASAGADATIHLWDVETASCQTVLKRGHTESIRALAFNRSGQLLASGSEDQTIQLWDMQNRRHLAPLKSARLCEGMNITGVTGLTDAQRASLKVQGAVDPDQ